MRNLKRALSLALASVMLLGMMVVGTSAASYPDVDENDNVEAIEVLNAVKVMIGEQGNFNPDSPVNRHQMAVIMAKLVLGNEIADKYVGTHPFTDVAPWADKYVAACYENGIVAGTSKTTFGGDQPLTAVQAAAFMLRALGYKDLSKGASDWSVPVTAMANQIRLFSGVASNPKEQLTRNQVARLALNTLKSPVVDLKDNTFTATDGDGKLIISGGNREYIVRSSSEAYAKAINSTEVAGTSASQISGYTIELGEHLYNGKLKLNTNAQDDFGRPSNNWQYDGKDIGTYVNYDLRVGEYKTGVTGAAMFELLTYTTINDNALLTYVDGVDNTAITKASLVRSNKNDLTGTGNGVLTEVFVDLDHKQVTITSINTYLAKANSDYNKANETLSLKVFASSWVGTTKPVDVKDVPQAADVAKDDYKLVYMSGKDSGATSITDYARFDVVDMFDVEVLTESTITKWSDVSQSGAGPFKVVDKLTTGGSEYKSNPKAYFNDTNVLDTYNRQVLTDNTYNIYLDRYGNVIGVDLFEGTKNYVFITGYDRGSSNISIKTADAGAIFMDGTMDTITVNVTDTNKNITSAQTVPTANRDYDAYSTWSTAGTGNGERDHNRWYTYTTASDGTYTLQPVKNFFYTSYDNANNTDKVASTVAAGQSVTLNSANLSLTDGRKTTGYTAKQRIYGNDDSVYITVEAGRVSNSCTTVAHDIVNTGTPALADLKDAITDVAGVYTGAQNVKIDLLPSVKQEINSNPTNTADAVHTKLTGANTNNERNAYVYSISDSNGYIIASIVMGEAQGATTNYVYTLSGVKSEWVEKAGSSRANDSDTYFWEFEAVANGEKTTLTVKSKWANAISPLVPYTVQEVRYDGDYVTKIIPVANAKAVYDNTADVDKKDVYDVGNVAGTAYSWANGVNSGYMDNNAANTDTDRISGRIQLVGRTLYTERPSDVGLALATDAKAVLIQPENGKREVTNCASVDEAIGRLADRNDALDGIQFQGRIVAALDDNGVAKWVVIISDTNLRTGSDPGYTQNATITLNGISGIASVSGLNLNGSVQYVEPGARYEMTLYDGYTATASGTGGTVSRISGSENRWTIIAPAKGYSLTVNVAKPAAVTTFDVSGNTPTINAVNLELYKGNNVVINGNWNNPSDKTTVALDIPEGRTLTVNGNLNASSWTQAFTGKGTLKVSGILDTIPTQQSEITFAIEAGDLNLRLGSVGTQTIKNNISVDRDINIHGTADGNVIIDADKTVTVDRDLTEDLTANLTITINGTLNVGRDAIGNGSGTFTATVLSSDSLHVAGIANKVNLVLGDNSTGKVGKIEVGSMVGGDLTLKKGTFNWSGKMLAGSVTVTAAAANDVTVTWESGATISQTAANALTGGEADLKTSGTNQNSTTTSMGAPSTTPAAPTYAAIKTLTVVGTIPEGLQSAGANAIDLSANSSAQGATAEKKAAAVAMDKVAADTRKNIDSQAYGVYTMSGNENLIKAWNWVPTTRTNTNWSQTGLQPGCIGYEYGTGVGRIFFRYDVPTGDGTYLVCVRDTTGAIVAAVPLAKGSTGGWIDQRNWSPDGAGSSGWVKTAGMDGSTADKHVLTGGANYSYDIVKVATWNKSSDQETTLNGGEVLYTGYFTALNNLANKGEKN